MKHIGLCIIACFLVLHLVYTEEASSKMHNNYEWTFEPKTDGSVHTKVKITLSGGYSCFTITSSSSTPKLNMKAWEADTGIPISITEADEGDKTKYTLEFQGTKRGGFQFFMEYDELEEVDLKRDETYYFYFGWTSCYETTHTATVVLPKSHELLYTNYIDPKEVSSALRLSIVFTEEVPEEETFRLGVMFSKTGVQLLKKADSNFRLRQYKEAKEAYKDAIRFYSQFSKLYNRDKVSFIAELTDYVSQCEAFLEEERIEYNTQVAEEKHQEGVTAFNSKEYAEAEQLFKQAQNMYKSVGNSEKADECQEYIDTCVAFAEQEQIRSEAEALFSEGETYCGQQLYEDAKAKFEEALAKYTELGDEEKINECNEWILTCEKELTSSVEENGGTCAGTSIVFVILLSSGLANRVRFRRKN